MRKNPCSVCQVANVNSTAEKPVCQKCRKAARTRSCSWCGVDYAHRDPRRETCSPDCGAAYSKFMRYGWTLNAVKRIVEEVAGG